LRLTFKVWGKFATEKIYIKIHKILSEQTKKVDEKEILIEKDLIEIFELEKEGTKEQEMLEF
jgi:hypothetical protein